MHPRLTQWFTPLQFGNEKVRYKEYSPTVELRPFIACYWTVTSKQFAFDQKTQLKVLPDGCIDFVFHWHPSFGYVGNISGAMNQYADIPIHSGSDFIGIRFRPSGLRALFNVSVASYSDLSITLSDIDKVWTNIQYQLTETTDRISLLNTVLLQRLKQTTSVQNDASITNLLHRIYLHQGNIKVQKLAEKEFMSSRHVQRLFMDWIGLSPKTFCRIVRLQYSLRFLYEKHELMGAPISAEYGYSDQAHFIREFRTYTGMTPSNYMSDFFKTN